MSKTIFENLRMAISCDNGEHSLSLSVESGFIGFDVTIPLIEQDVAVLESDTERAAFLQAALHHPFQLKETRLDRAGQRYYLDRILHSPKSEVEDFLTNIDHGRANGAISNMVNTTCNKDHWKLRKGQWFNQ